MRFHTTLAFSTALTAATALRQKWHAMSDDAPDTESEKLGDEVDAAIDALLMMPATTPREVSKKIALIEGRYEGLTIGDMAKEMAALRADLDRLTRPNVSPAIAEAFAAFAAAYETLDKSEGLEDDCPEALAIADASSAAMRALMLTPCTTPGDFMVKVYVDLIGEEGGSYRTYEGDSRNHGFSFELEEINTEHRCAPTGELQHDAQAQIAFREDLMQSDLGACLFALGRVDFDAEAWIAAADRWGHGFYVMTYPDGRCSFGQSVGGNHDGGPNPPGWTSERETLLMRLLAGGLDLSSERIDAVVEATLANHPNHIHCLTEADAQAPTRHVPEAAQIPA